MNDRLTIAYGFSNCSNAVYEKLFSENRKFVMVTDQKYHGLLNRGMQMNGAKVQCFSGLPINRDVTDKIIIRENNDSENGIDYHYYTTLNLPLIRQVMVFCGGFFNILLSEKKYDCVLCDFMSTMNALGIGLAAKIKGIPVIEIVMDLPDLMNTKGTPVKGIHRAIANMADGFVFLTKQMDEVVNSKKKPFIVLEGHVDKNLSKIGNEQKWEITEGKKVIIYAGGVHKIFGIDYLVEGFIKASIQDSELRVFGDGDYREDLERICKQNNNIVYMGVKENREIVYQEQRASLLVNPRPSAPVYTKYSFPSKNMEYMVSGTPVLTTCLPGMPDEYKDYVYVINDENVDGVAESIKTVFRDSFEERCKKADAARNFVMENKNNRVQAAKILTFITNEVIPKR